MLTKEEILNGKQIKSNYEIYAMKIASLFNAKKEDASPFWTADMSASHLF